MLISDTTPPTETYDLKPEPVVATLPDGFAIVAMPVRQSAREYELWYQGKAIARDAFSFPAAMANGHKYCEAQVVANLTKIASEWQTTVIHPETAADAVTANDGTTTAGVNRANKDASTTQPITGG